MFIQSSTETYDHALARQFNLDTLISIALCSIVFLIWFAIRLYFRRKH